MAELTAQNNYLRKQIVRLPCMKDILEDRIAALKERSDERNVERKPTKRHRRTSSRK
jgi:hypothetical protein